MTLDSLMQGGWDKVRYDYNALGQPVRRWRGDINSMAIDRYWLWDGDQLLLELDRDGNRLGEYLYHPGAVDQPHALVHGATSPVGVRYFQQDELGVLGLSDGTSISQSLSYDAWGTPTVSGSGQGSLYWKGLLWDGDVVQLYYMRNRWYDPELGRFVSEDPIGHSGGINLYVFAGNDPVNASDPDGLGHCGKPGQPPCPLHPLPPVIITRPPARPQVPRGIWDFDRSRGWDWDCYGRAETVPQCAEPQPDVGEEAVRACQGAILSATGSLVLELSGARALYSGAKSLISIARLASVNSRLGVPSFISAGNIRDIQKSIVAVGNPYAVGVGRGYIYSGTTETILAQGFDWVNYVPIPFVSSVNSVIDASIRCAAPAGR